MPPGMIFDRDQDWEQGRCCRSRVMSDNAADGVIRNQLPDDTLLVFLSDTHIGGAAGSDIFESAAELTLLLEDLNRHQGPVELVLAGDFLDVLRILYDALGLESAQLAVAVAGRPSWPPSLVLEGTHDLMLTIAFARALPSVVAMAANDACRLSASR